MTDATSEELTRQAELFEAAWQKRAQTIEDDRDRRNRRIQRQFWFLFAFLFAAFILLAYRTETNSQEIRVGFYRECADRQVRIIKSNEGREALITIIVNNPKNPVPPEQVSSVVQQLRDGLLLPVEDCGPDPSQ